jgi:myosin heavy subunit
MLCLQAPLEFEGALCLRQLKYAGLFEAIRIRKSGFFYRHPNTQFYGAYWMLAFKERNPVSRDLLTSLPAHWSALIRESCLSLAKVR